MSRIEKERILNVPEIHKAIRAYDLFRLSATVWTIRPRLSPFLSTEILLPQQIDHSIFLLRNARSIRPLAREDRADRYHSRRGTKRDRGSVYTAAKDRVKVMK